MSYSTRRTAEEWSKIVDSQPKSGQTISAFCRDQGIKAGTFYYWRSRLQESEEREEEGFIKLRPQLSGSGIIVLRLGSDLEVELPPDYSPSALSELILFFSYKGKG